MAKSTAENTFLRLKTVLDVLTEGVWSGDALNAGQVLAEATARVPFNDHEAELLSGGIPRGHKTLTSATAKLVKAGWLVKGRSGWTITDDGMRATVAFPDPVSFATALDAGTPVPADTPVPAAPAGFVRKFSAPAAAEPAAAEGTAKKPAKKAPAKKAAAAVGKAAKALEDAVEPVVKAVRTRKAPAKKADAEAAAGAPAEPFEGPDVETHPQPEAVAVAGDFNTILGAPENWAPQYDEAQMEFDFLDQQWKKSADLPAGYYTFKIALNRSWAENYGAFGAFDGPNHELHHAGGTVTIRYNHATRDITIN
ncbi:MULTISPECIES: glycosidase [unclassified Arthrobacter]|uniref:pullulanase X25 domain-containing protein n=1 Tax=unclassified Arthrobacter TaxID=235627 RepID=UPI001C8490D3|nr:glycosidase [Arthrobacter sp. MAHUQ-56]MBX7445731.1 glycosidase [Arthrobacter sp. MAHUQ-56]